jgi:hypothetical protein
MLVLSILFNRTILPTQLATTTTRTADVRIYCALLVNCIEVKDDNIIWCITGGFTPVAYEVTMLVLSIPVNQTIYYVLANQKICVGMIICALLVNFCMQMLY